MDAVNEAAVVVERVRAPHDGEQAIARVLQRQVEVRHERPLRATRSTISGVQSIGSSELTRYVTSASIASRARSSARSDVRGVRSRPYEPRWTPAIATSLKPAFAHAADVVHQRFDRQAVRRAAR